MDIAVQILGLRERTAFGKTISEFEMVQDKIAEMMAGAYAMESMIYATAGLTARPEPIDYSIESAICKVFATETLWSVVNHAVQINGGNGFMKEYPYERFLRDARVNMIFEGTNEILRLFIALSGMDPRGSDGGDSNTPEPLATVHPDLPSAYKYQPLPPAPSASPAWPLPANAPASPDRPRRPRSRTLPYGSDPIVRL